MAEFKVRRGYGPEVSADTAKVPGIYISDRAGAIYAGGLRNLASGLSALSSGVASFAEKQKLEKKRQDAFTSQMELTNAQGAAAEIYTNSKINAEPGAPNIVANNSNAIGQYANSVLQKLQEQGVGPEAMRAAQLGFANIQQGMIQKSLSYQEQSREQYFDNQVQDLVKKTGNLAADDPEAVEGFIAQLDSIIETWPANVNEMVREDVRRRGAEAIRLAAAESYAHRYPERVVGAFKSYTPEQQIQAMSVGISGVESGGNYSAVNDTSGALGKYQVMPANVGAWTRAALGTRMSPREFLASPAAQEAVFKHRMGLYLEKTGNLRDAASLWFTGTTYANAVSQGRHDGANSVQQYVAKVEGYLSGQPHGFANGDNDPVLAGLSAKQRLATLRAAEAQINQNQTALRAELMIDMKNHAEAMNQGLSYNGREITPDRIVQALDGPQAEQAMAAYQAAEKRGEFIAGMKPLSLTEGDAEIARRKPSDTSSPTYQTEMAEWDIAKSAWDAVKTARTQDAAGYVMQNFPEITARAAAMAEEGRLYDGELFQMMEEAYDQLQIPLADRKAFNDSMMENLKTQFEQMGGTEKRQNITAMMLTMSPDMQYQTLHEIDEEGFPHEAYAAGLVLQSPSHAKEIDNALKGVEYLEENKTLDPARKDFHLAWRNALGQSQRDLGPNAGTAFDLALGLYAMKYGDVSVVETDKFNAAVREIFGGSADNEDTGIVDLSGAGMPTILPADVTGSMFNDMYKQYFGDDDYTIRGNGPLMNVAGFQISAADVANEGIFVRVGPEEYSIYFPDGGYAVNPQGERYIMSISSRLVNYATRELARGNTSTLRVQNRIEREVDAERGPSSFEAKPALPEDNKRIYSFPPQRAEQVPQETNPPAALTPPEPEVETREAPGGLGYKREKSRSLVNQPTLPPEEKAVLTEDEREIIETLRRIDQKPAYKGKGKIIMDVFGGYKPLPPPEESIVDDQKSNRGAPPEGSKRRKANIPDVFGGYRQPKPRN